MAAEEGQAEGSVAMATLVKRMVMWQVALRVAATLACLVCFILIASDSLPGLLTFRDVQPFCYMLVVAVVVCGYSLVQSVIGVNQLRSGNHEAALFHYHHHLSLAMDLMCTILLVSGSSAMLGVTTINYITVSGVNFITQANAAAGLGLFAALFLLASAGISARRFIPHP